VKILETEIQGVCDILLDALLDERGFFARLYCPNEFAKAGIQFTPSQINMSRNYSAFTLRGMHWQDPPFGEAKIVRVTAGAAHDVVVDLRPESSTFRRWLSRRLSAEEATAIFIPEGCAHGFLTLTPETDILYHMSRPYVGGKARGFRWDDPEFAIEWPAEPRVISQADRKWSCPISAVR
jgi:dTDP-4-dehydrorhamnose 3,5-epimerase